MTLIRIFLIAALIGLLCSLCSAQTIYIQPYLQDALPNSIYILWETDDQNNGTVEWGLTEDLGNSVTATSEVIEGAYRVNAGFVEGLERFTTYYYKVVSGEAESPVYSFKTPPFASDHMDFRIVAMSDMQQDGAFPDKFQEVVEDGVISYLENEFGGEIEDNLALVIIPGDLVVNGNDYSSWDNTFFEPSEQLFSRVPVYPVLGNHEYNSVFYVNYFKLPENGIEGLEEHAWHKDYGNVRIIGMDSNGGYATEEQLSWLQETLDETCAADSIDFVFAQLHHPHHSELWTPGNLDYTGEVIAALEQFSSNCGKPSIHFFGHTHAYSRGHSRDHKHLMVNAASAGGAIDNWGEFPNFDYEEYAKSTDEYGFVTVEITADDDPTVTVKHFAMGDQEGSSSYVLNDEVSMKKNPSVSATPIPLYPVNLELAPECVILRGNNFISDSENAEHGQSQWQVTTSEEGFDSPVVESWKNFENWYFEQDTQASDDLTDEEVIGLSTNTEYLWRVRYRDKELNWSDWSEPATFVTTQTTFSGNLLVNSGAENDLAQWETTEGIVEVQTDGACNGIAPYAGEKYFAVGGLCEHSDVGRLIQDVDVSTYVDSIDAEVFTAKFGGYMSNYNGTDSPEMRLLFFDEDNVFIQETEYISSQLSSWTLHQGTVVIPAGIRTIQFEMKGTRNGGEDNDSYFDEVFLQIGSTNLDCSEVSSVTNVSAPRVLSVEAYPNPAISETSLEYPNSYSSRIHVLNSIGEKVNTEINSTDKGFTIKTENLPRGMYYFIIRESGKVTGAGKFVKE